MKPVVYVFIDASNLWATQKVKGLMFDFSKLKSFLIRAHNASKIVIYYYTAYPANDTRDYSLDPRHKFLLYLKKELGFIVRKKELKRIVVHSEAGNKVEEKGNMDVEMTIDAVTEILKYQTLVLFSGDSDFLALINHVKQHGKKVYVYSSRNNISHELRTAGDGYTDILKITEDIWGKQLRYRTQK